MKYLWILRSCFVVLFSSSVNFPVLAQSSAQPCEGYFKDIPVRATVASAGFWANMQDRQGSLSYESNAIFHEAKAKSSLLQYPGDFCSRGCSLAQTAVLHFKSIPHKVLTEYDDASHCESLRSTSTKKPYVYETTALRTIDELNAWIKELSQGDGEYGEDLYEKCDKSCSPRYEYTVQRMSDAPRQYRVQATIICGGARDKDDDQYDLSAFFRWNCQSNTRH